MKPEEKKEMVFELFVKVLENAELEEVTIRQGGALLRMLRAICPEFDESLIKNASEIRQNEL